MATMRCNTLDYAKADALLGNRSSRKVFNNTFLVREDGFIGLRLHATYVIKFYSTGRVRYFSGGFMTVTTKDRFARFGPARVYQKNHEWFLSDGRDFFEGVDAFPPPPEARTLEALADMPRATKPA
jgi:hypothetical protein